MPLKRELGFIILIILTISIVLIPISIISVLKNLDVISIKPSWDYYIEPRIYTAQEEIHKENITYTSETYMWRDFMPISPPGGKPLIVIIKVHANNAEFFPLTTKIERLWIIDDTNILSTSTTDECTVEGSTIEMVFRNGPK